MEAVSIASSVVSVALAVVAIWLSITFYRLSNDSSNRIQESSKDLGASVERLEKLFDRLYSDMFGMMRETVTDMRRHVWPEKPDGSADAEVEERAREKLEAIRGEFERQVSELVERVGSTDASIASLRDDVLPLARRAISESSRVEAAAREETIRQAILRCFNRISRDRRVIARELVDHVQERGFEFGDILAELKNMRTDEILHWHSDELLPDTKIYRGPALPPEPEREDPAPVNT